MQSLKRREIISIGGLILALFLALYFSAAAQEEQAATDETKPAIIERQNNFEERQQENAERVETRQNQEERSGNAEARQELKAERVDGRQELQAERKGALEEARQNRIMNLSANISNRMEAAIARLEAIIVRFEERIDKIAETGINVDAAKSKLDEARNLLREAKDKISNIDNLVYNATTSNEARLEWKKVRETYLEAGKLIRGSHADLRETLSLLKTAVSESGSGRSEAVRNNEQNEPEAE